MDGRLNSRLDEILDFRDFNSSSSSKNVLFVEGKKIDKAEQTTERGVMCEKRAKQSRSKVPRLENGESDRRDVIATGGNHGDEKSITDSAR